MNKIIIYQIVLQNLSFNCCTILKKGTIGVITDREPNFIYERIGNAFVANDSGFVSCYQYVPGSTDGFAGREISLKVYGGIVFKNKGSHVEKFKGSLWDSVNAARAFEEKYKTKLYSIAQKSDSGYRKCPVFYSGYVTQERIDEIKAYMELQC